MAWLGLGTCFRVRVSDHVDELSVYSLPVLIRCHTAAERPPITVQYADILTSVDLLVGQHSGQMPSQKQFLLSRHAADDPTLTENFLITVTKLP